MLNPKTNLRELAYIVSIDEIKPIPNYDRVEYVRTSGWWVICKKGQFQVGDLAVFIEIDSKTPATEPFSFLEKKHYKIKTQKMCGVISQGLLMSFEDFGWDKDYHKLGDLVTQELGITYSVKEDNKRKAPGVDKYKAMVSRKPKLFKKPWARWMMKRDWGKKVMFLLFGRKRDKRASWPSHICSKTDVERIQNMPFLLGDEREFIATEKIDGSSATFAAERGRFGKISYWVCSRNVVFKDYNQPCYYDSNIYHEMYQKYGIRDILTRMLKDLNVDNIAIQGEVYGDGVQKRDYSLTGGKHRLMVFHIVSNGKKFPMERVESLCEAYGLPHVPILDSSYHIPSDIDELRAYVEGAPSKLDGKPREGIVFYDKETGQTYTKFVSPNYLLKYH